MFSFKHNYCIPISNQKSQNKSLKIPSGHCCEQFYEETFSPCQTTKIPQRKCPFAFSQMVDAMPERNINVNALLPGTVVMLPGLAIYYISIYLCHILYLGMACPFKLCYTTLAVVSYLFTDMRTYYIGLIICPTIY